MKRTIYLLIVACFVITTLFGCARKREEIRIGYIPIAECIPLYAAVENGYFQDVGLNVKLIQFSGGALILEALRAGSIDIGFSNLVSLVMAKAGGSNFVAMCGTTVENKQHVIHGLVVRKDSKINNPKDLEEKTIALNTLKNIDELLIKKYLQIHDLDIKKIKLIEIPFPRMATVLLNNYVDAIAVVEPFLTLSTIEETNKVIGYYFIDAYPEVEITSYCAEENWIKQNKEIVDKFQECMNKSINFTITNELEARKTLLTYTKLKSDVINKISLPKFSINLPSPKFLQWLISEMQRERFIKQEIDSSSLIYKR